MIPVYVVDIMGEVVSSVQTEVLEQIQANETAAIGQTSIQNIDYQKGYVKELIQTLQQMDKDETQRFLKYPLIWLVMDFKEGRGRTAGIYTQTSLDLIIAHQTDQSYKVSDRYEKVFKPVLYPIYVSFLNQIAKHPMIMQGDDEMISHDKWDRSYWGNGGSKSQLTDFVDAIEINNLALNIIFKNCS